MNNYPMLVQLLDNCRVELLKKGVNEEYKSALRDAIKALTKLKRYW